MEDVKNVKIQKRYRIKRRIKKKCVNIDEYKDYYWITNFGRCFSKKTNKEIKSHINDGYYSNINLK